MLARVACQRDEIPTEILFGGEGVVGTATECEVAQAMLAASRERHQVMELEVRRLSAALTRVTAESAAAFVALEDGTTERGGHVSAALARALGSVLELGARFGIMARLGRVASGKLAVRGRLCNRWRCGLGRGRVSYALARPVRCCVFLPPELRHQSTHGAEMQLAQVHARSRLREKRFRLLDELDVLLARFELHFVALRLQRPR